jgi:anti-sigma factor RsiW
MTKFSDETLMLYADGLLEASESGRVSKALTQDARLRARLQVFRSTGRGLAALFEPHAATPLPPGLRDIVNGAVPPISSSPVRNLREPLGSRAWRAGWKQGAALAACLALLAGIGLGWLLHGGLAGTSASPSQEIVRSNGGRLIAGDVLGHALESLPGDMAVQTGGGRSADVSVRMTFQDAAGHYCRQYQISAPQPEQYAGVACRVDGVWRVDFQALVPRAPSVARHIVPAGGSSEIMDAVIGAIIAGDPLSSESEAALLKNRWTK